MQKTETAARVAKITGLQVLLRRVVTWRGVLVLTHHRVGHGERSIYDRASWSATPERFDQQLTYLKKNADVVSTTDLVELSQKRPGGRYVMLAFDDAYRDSYYNAFRLLRQHGLPATFFITTGFIDDGSPSWWDEIAWMVHTSTADTVPGGEWLSHELSLAEARHGESIKSLLHAYKTLPGERTEAFLAYLAERTGAGRHPREDEFWMNWEMVRELRSHGMEIGAHTVHHPVLSRLSEDDQRAEIAGSKARLEEELREPIRFFSYPTGLRDSFDGTTVRCLEDQGFELAFSLYGGFNAFDSWNPYDVRRSSLRADTTPEMFRMMVTLPRFFARW